MTLFEAVVVVVVIVAATVAAILNHFTPELGALLGIALGYAGKGAVAAVKNSGETPWKGTPSE